MILFEQNISVFEIKENIIFIHYRNKIKTTLKKTNFTKENFENYLKQKKINNIRQLGKYYFNFNKLLLIEENLDIPISKKNNIWVQFIFEIDYFEVELDKDYWVFWKDNNKID